MRHHNMLGASAVQHKNEFGVETYKSERMGPVFNVPADTPIYQVQKKAIGPKS